MDQFNFRTATNRDKEKIIALVKEILPEFNLVYSPQSSEQDLQDIQANYMEQGGTFEVIENSDKEIIGTIGLLKLDNHKCKIRKMYVDKRYRRSGLGEMLLKRILRIASELGFKEVVLETVHDMATAIHLYEKHGFQKAKGPQAVSPRCDIVMTKRIG